MACACKDKIKKVERLIPEVNGVTFEKKGWKYYWRITNHVLLVALQRIIMAILVLIIILPVAAVVLIMTIIFNKQLNFKIPKKLVKRIQQLDKNG